MRPRITLALALATLAIVATGCAQPSGTPSLTSGGTPGKAITDLGTVEVRQYQGQKLSSVADEPENSIKGPQYVDESTYRLTVDGLVKSPLKLTYSEVTSMPPVKKVVTLNCVEGWSVTYLWQGVLLRDLLEKAGGTDPSAKVLIFHCVDGYTSSLPLDYVLNNNIMLGYKMNGVTMPAERGYPFQVVAEDRFGYKWAKWVQRIEVSSDVNYLGYWEKRGYDNTGTLPFGK